MRHATAHLLLPLALLLSACVSGVSDCNKPGANASIVDTWVLDKLQGPAPDGSPKVYTASEIQSAGLSYWTFTRDHRVTAAADQSGTRATTIGTYTLSKDRLEITPSAGAPLFGSNKQTFRIQQLCPLYLRFGSESGPATGRQQAEWHLQFSRTTHH